MDDDAFSRDLQATGDVNWGRLNTRTVALDAEGVQLAVPAPNAIEWVVGKDWCDSPATYEYWGQYKAIRDFFELRCPNCNEGDGEVWGKSRTELESEVLLVWSTDHQEDVCPKCSNTRSDFIEDGYFSGFNTMHMVIGQRAGKSVCAALIGTYIEHRIITIGLNTVGGFGESLNLKLKDPFEMTFLAATAVQSQDTIWAKYTTIRAGSPWFQRFVPWVKRQQAQQVVPAGMKPWSYKETDTRIINQHPNVRLLTNSMNSNAPGLRGRTRPAAFADEVSHMEQTDSKKSATEIYRALERSLRTVRSRVKLYGGLPWLGTMVSVTSPVSRSDKGMQLLQDAKKVRTMFACHAPTWEFNPYEPRENLNDEFEKDPIGAARDYGAQPPGSEYPLVHDERRWRALSVDTKLEPRAEFETYSVLGKTGQPYVAIRMLRSGFSIHDRTPRFVVWDAGKNFDAFAGACAHGEWVETEGRSRLVTVYDWVARILPSPGTEVLFESVHDVMRDLIRATVIGRVEFDRWQSVQIIQQVRELGVFAEQRSTKDSDYMQWKIDCFDGIVRMLPPRPHEHERGAETFLWTVEPPQLSAEACGIYELLGLQCDPDTHKVTAPEKGQRRGYGSNDVAQVLVHAHALVQRQGYTERQDDRSTRAARRRVEVTGQDYGRRGALAHGRRAPGRGTGRGW